jgi:hypothetical protein
MPPWSLMQVNTEPPDHAPQLMCINDFALS